MKIELWSLGKSHDDYVKTGVEMFTKRINNYYTVEWKIISPPKNASNLPTSILMEKEAEQILTALKKDDFLILLDETGKMLDSPALAEMIRKRADQATKVLVFLIGGAFGVTPQVRARANFSLSLSKLVFPHQLVRLIMAEQVYRACSINNNEKYHHI